MTAIEALRAVPSIPRRDDAPIFAKPWEARAFALAVHLNERGLFSWAEWAGRFGANLRANTEAGECLTYYEVWWQTLEEFGEEKSLASSTERARRAAEWREAAARTPHGQPIELRRSGSAG